MQNNSNNHIVLRIGFKTKVNFQWRIYLWNKNFIFVRLVAT